MKWLNFSYSCAQYEYCVEFQWTRFASCSFCERTEKCDLMISLLFFVCVDYISRDDFFWIIFFFSRKKKSLKTMKKKILLIFTSRALRWMSMTTLNFGRFSLWLPPRNAIKQFFVFWCVSVKRFEFICRRWIVRGIASRWIVGRVRWSRRGWWFWTRWRWNRCALHWTRWIIRSSRSLTETWTWTRQIGIIFIKHILQSTNIFNGQFQCINFAKFFTSTSTTMWQRGNNIGWNMLTQIGKTIVHLFHTIAFASVAPLHWCRLLCTVWHVHIIHFWFFTGRNSRLIDTWTIGWCWCRCNQSLAETMMWWLWLNWLCLLWNWRDHCVRLNLWRWQRCHLLLSVLLMLLIGKHILMHVRMHWRWLWRCWTCLRYDHTIVW